MASLCSCLYICVCSCVYVSVNVCVYVCVCVLLWLILFSVDRYYCCNLYCTPHGTMLTALLHRPAHCMPCSLLRCTVLQPKRSKEASRAMRNPSCGYDFVSRLEERGDFMER